MSAGASLTWTGIVSGDGLLDSFTGSLEIGASFVDGRSEGIGLEAACEGAGIELTIMCCDASIATSSTVSNDESLKIVVVRLVRTLRVLATWLVVPTSAPVCLVVESDVARTATPVNKPLRPETDKGR